MRLCARVLCCAGIALSVTDTVDAGNAQIVYASSTHVPTGNARADVPGMPGLVFANFGRMYGSSGTNWIVAPTIAGTGVVNASDQVVLAGSGLVGSAVAREGVTTVDDNQTLLNLSGGVVPRINKQGEWVLAFTPAGTTSGLVVKKTASGFSTIAATLGSAPGVGPGITWGNLFAGASISDTGEVAFQADNIQDLPTLQGPRANMRADGGQLVLRSGISVPTGQANAGTSAATAISYNALSFVYHLSADGSKTLSQVTLGDAPTGQQTALVINNDVILQAGQTLGADVVTSISTGWLESNGDWFAQVSLTPTAGGTATTAVLRNGVVIARVGRPIASGSTENWAGITDFKGNKYKQWCVVGTTNAPSNTNWVAVVDGTVVARAGDPVAIENDGLFNDSLFIQRFNDRCFLGNDHFFYAAVQLRTTASGATAINNNYSMIRVAIPSISCSPADIADGLGDPLPPFGAGGGFNPGLDGGDFDCFFNYYFEPAPINAVCDIADGVGDPLPPFGPGTGFNPGVDGGDFDCFFNFYFNGCL